MKRDPGFPDKFVMEAIEGDWVNCSRWLKYDETFIKDELLGRQLISSLDTSDPNSLAGIYASVLAVGPEVAMQKLKDRIGAFQIFVKLLTGKTITLDVRRSDTIDDVMTKLQDKVVISETTHFSICGSRLEVGRPLSDYNISKKDVPDTLWCNGRLRAAGKRGGDDDSSSPDDVPSSPDDVPSSPDDVPGLSSQYDELVLIGTEAVPTGTEIVPIGTEAVPIGTEAVPIGGEAVPKETEAVPIGTEIVPTDTEAVSTGDEVVSTGAEAVPIGTEIAPTDTEAVPETKRGRLGPMTEQEYDEMVWPFLEDQESIALESSEEWHLLEKVVFGTRVVPMDNETVPIDGGIKYSITMADGTIADDFAPSNATIAHLKSKMGNENLLIAFGVEGSFPDIVDDTVQLCDLKAFQAQPTLMLTELVQEPSAQSRNILFVVAGYR